ncbi:ornithine cyclodeaminase family protein [Halorubrum lacusprofundi]|jgi:alanine dehydrogenase|uniref:Ornithine cyclodeaminase/mu-crystallin n=1 Tax=Halorubrum lacusprofundi (strain ATCC 49239 / DSM 5036 / JCM 8891 / ACAM 34) TaxID=416348 RepID=B9LQI9_HALLT|nr:ornithine cyclodeaminase family protein [Halorubrum lacusprofundi]ACM57610.1 ornithine cyclodeaminase/mu-crystallin [Halorubrum lacusprofundi ATCC 49239]MCG1005793.1 ornithine cyclodeaminase family protein [Halorubrum lacusprofundi]
MTDTLFLTSADVDDLAEPADYVAVVRDAYRQIGEGAPAEPRTKLLNREPPGMLTTYAAVLPETGAMGGYTYSAGFGAGDAWFMTPLFDAESGEPLALLDGASMNPFKTGAAGAVAVDALARADATEIAVIGSGAQARGQLATTATVRDFEAVRVFSPTAENREAFAEEFDDRLDADVSAVASASEALDGADVVITATTASEPVIDDADVEPGTHVTAMGQYHPKKNELPPELIARATYVPDIRARAAQDAGSFLAAIEAGLIDEDHVAADLGEVVAGEHPGRTSDDEVTVFDSGGTGIETVAAAHMLYKRASEDGRGQTIDFAPASEALTGK